MRIATNSASAAMLARIQSLSENQARLQTQVSTGQRIFSPEDDPAAVGRVMNWTNERKTLEQYKKNGDRALDLSKATYSALTEIKKISDRAGELATLGAGSPSPDAYRAYAKEVKQLIEQAQQIGNTQFRNDYIFAGTNVSTKPYTLTYDAGGEVDTVTYAGNTAQSTIQLSENSTITPGADSSTTAGIQTFLQNLGALSEALAANDSTAVSAAQTALTGSENLFVDALAKHGAIEMRIEVSQRQQDSRLDNIENLVSGEADVDFASAVVKLSQASTAYEAALASGTKVLQMSILDYLS